MNKELFSICRNINIWEIKAKYHYHKIDYKNIWYMIL